MKSDLPKTRAGGHSQTVESDSLERVRGYIKERGIEVVVRVLPPESTRTSELAARSLECTTAEIAKTICFLARLEGEWNPVLVTLSGARQVSLHKLAGHLGLPVSAIRKMSAEEVKLHTGYSIGGVPPFPHTGRALVLADVSLFQFSHVWAAAGKSNSFIRIDPHVLHGPVADLSKQKEGGGDFGKLLSFEIFEGYSRG